MDAISLFDQDSKRSDDERLADLMSGLKVPPSSITNDEAWERINHRIVRIERSDRVRMKLMHIGALVLLFIAVVSIILDWHFAMKTIEAPAGKIAYGMLPDSTLVTINAGSKIKHREFSYKKNRMVKIEGEAFFVVDKKEIDFQVIAGKSSVDVKSARFNVYYRYKNLRVECHSGEVQVKMVGISDHIISAGQGLIASPSLPDVKIFNLDAHIAASWLRGEFFYKQSPLSMVFDEVERQFNVTIKVQGFDPEQFTYSGSFTNENLKNALNQICNPMALEYSFEPKPNTVKIYPKE